MTDRVDVVGPVLEAGPVACAIVAAIRELDPTIQVTDRGAYVRVLAAGRCRVTRAAIELALGRPFQLPGDLERVMPSFAGRFTVSEDEALWELGR